MCAISRVPTVMAHWDLNGTEQLLMLLVIPVRFRVRMCAVKKAHKTKQPSRDKTTETSYKQIVTYQGTFFLSHVCLLARWPLRIEKMSPFSGNSFLYCITHCQFVVCVFVVSGMIIKRKSGEIPCPLAVEAFAAHLSYICKYDDKYSKYVLYFTKIHLIQDSTINM